MSEKLTIKFPECCTNCKYLEYKRSFPEKSKYFAGGLHCHKRWIRRNKLSTEEKP